MSTVNNTNPARKYPGDDERLVIIQTIATKS